VVEEKIEEKARERVEHAEDEHEERRMQVAASWGAATRGEKSSGDGKEAGKNGTAIFIRYGQGRDDVWLQRRVERRLDATTSGTGSAGVGEAGGSVLVAVVVANMRSRAGGAADLDVTRAVLAVHVEEVGVVLQGRLEVSTASDELVKAERLVLGAVSRKKGKSQFSLGMMMDARQAHDWWTMGAS
jgi:hypothetical protein